MDIRKFMADATYDDILYSVRVLKHVMSQQNVRQVIALENQET